MKIRICTLLGIGTLLLAVVTSLVVRADDAEKEKKRTRCIEHAKAYVQLLQLDLQMAQARNKSIPNSYPRALIVLLEEQVAVAQAWSEHAQAPSASPADFTIRSAEIYVSAAKANYDNALELNKLGALNAQDLERTRLKYELAQLSLGWAKEIDASSPIALMQFHVVRLHENVNELMRTQMELLDRN